MTIKKTGDWSTVVNSQLVSLLPSSILICQCGLPRHPECAISCVPFIYAHMRGDTGYQATLISCVLSQDSCVLISCDMGIMPFIKPFIYAHICPRLLQYLVSYILHPGTAAAPYIIYFLMILYCQPRYCGGTICYIFLNDTIFLKSSPRYCGGTLNCNFDSVSPSMVVT